MTPIAFSKVPDEYAVGCFQKLSKSETPLITTGRVLIIKNKGKIENIRILLTVLRKGRALQINFSIRPKIKMNTITKKLTNINAIKTSLIISISRDSRELPGAF